MAPPYAYGDSRLRPLQGTQFQPQLPPGINPGDVLPFEYGQVREEQVRGETGVNSLREGLRPAAIGRLWDPLQGASAWEQFYNQDPRIQQAQGQQDWNMNRMNQAATQLSGQTSQYQQAANQMLGGKFMGQLRGQALGTGPSLAEKYGAAQRQQAQGDIARQAAMGARGGMSAADRRTAIMQSGNVGANMASQIAAARTQEQQQAQQNYMAARQAQLAARQSGLTARQADAQYRGQVAQMRMNALQNAQQYRGGIAQTAQTGYGQFTTSAENSGLLPG